jgi:hypothetical protein
MSQQNRLLNDTVLKVLKPAGVKKVEHTRINPIRIMSLSKTFLAIHDNDTVVKIWFHLIEDLCQIYSDSKYSLFVLMAS